MILSPHTLSAPRGARKRAKRLGRGNGSGKGTSAGRGTKGQRARSGGKSGTARRGFKSSLQKIPKLRGFSSHRAAKAMVTLAMLDRTFSDGDTITPAQLRSRSLVADPAAGVKIVASGEIHKKLIVQGCLASKKAVDAVEKAGGTVSF